MPHVSREKFPYPISGVSRENITHPQSFTTFFPQVACAMQIFHENVPCLSWKFHSPAILCNFFPTGSLCYANFSWKFLLSLMKISHPLNLFLFLFQFQTQTSPLLRRVIKKFWSTSQQVNINNLSSLSLFFLKTYENTLFLSYSSNLPVHCLHLCIFQHNARVFSPNVDWKEQAFGRCWASNQTCELKETQKDDKERKGWGWTTSKNPEEDGQRGSWGKVKNRWYKYFKHIYPSYIFATFQ